MGLKVTTDFDVGSELHERILNDDRLKEEYEIEQTKYLFRSTLDRYKVEDGTTFNSSKHPGDIKMDTINTWLNKCSRSTGQKDFHQMFLATCLRVIYGDDYAKERHRVMVKYGFKSKKQQALICAPRRFGKTFSVAFFTVVIGIILPEVEISIFSPGKRQSVALMNHIYTFVKKLDQLDRVVQKNEEKMVLRTLNGRESKINAYPSAVKTLKGVGGTIIIMEEVAALDPAVLFEVICPLHQLEITSLIGISTITTEDNFFTKYLEMKDKNNELLFSVAYVHLACLPCREAGKAAACSHNTFMLPGWNSQRKRRTVNAMMAGEEEMLAREITGVANAKHAKAFAKKLVDNFKDRERVMVDYSIDYPTIFISIDPNAGGKESQFAITTMIVKAGQYTIVGMETVPSKTASENFSVILNHVQALDDTLLYQNAIKVFIIEANLGYESEHISNMLRDNVRNHMVISGPNGRVGFTTTNQMKQLAVERLREHLGMGTLSLGEEGRSMVCCTSSYSKVTGLLFDQLRNFAEVIKYQEHASAPKKQYSGKIHGPDDLVMTLLFAVFYIPYFFSKPEYTQFL